MKRVVALVAILFALSACASVDKAAVVESMAEKAGIVCWVYMPNSHDYVESVCALKEVLTNDANPAAAQALLKEAIGQLWVQAGDTGTWLVQSTLNDFVRFSGLNAKSISSDNVKEWLAAVEAFCGGIEMAKKM